MWKFFTKGDESLLLCLTIEYILNSRLKVGLFSKDLQGR